VTELDLSKLAAKGAVRAAKASKVDLGKMATMLLNFPELQVRFSLFLATIACSAVVRPLKRT
jgi:hypothetical protein